VARGDDIGADGQDRNKNRNTGRNQVRNQVGDDDPSQIQNKGRNDAMLDAIVEHGRQTRQRTPRWLWIAASIVGVICATSFAILMLAPAAPTAGIDRAGVSRDIDRGPTGGSGLGLGLVIGVAVGLGIGIAIGRQLRHSSRSTP
jgi:hypothetical protein